MKQKVKKGQELTFDIYGTKVAGKFISFEANDLIKIEVTCDEMGVNSIGDVVTINKNYLVVKEEDQNHNEKIIIGGHIFAPVTERINGSDIDEIQLSTIHLPNFDYVQKMRDMENILEEKEAIRLIKKFENLVMIDYCGDEEPLIDNQIECAIIAVEEIIKTYSDDWCRLDFWTDELGITINFWKKVLGVLKSKLQ